MTQFLLLQRTLHIFLGCLLAQLSLAADRPGVKTITVNHAPGMADATIVDPAPLAYTAQMLPLNARGELVGPGNATEQMEQVCAQVARALQTAGADFKRAVKLNICAANPNAVAAARKVLAQKFPRAHQPAVAFVAGGLPHPGALVAMDAVAVSKIKANTVRQFGTASVLPQGGLVYISGEADKGELPEATAGTLQKLEKTLGFLGVQKADVVQCKVFINPISDTIIARAEFEKFFAGQPLPPLVFVEWISRNPLIEIEMIAMTKNGNASSSALEYLTPPGITPSPVYAKVVRVNHGKQVYVSGLYGNSSNQAMAEVTEIYASLTRILQMAGSDLQHLAKATYYVSNQETSGQLNTLRPKYYDPKRPPAASKAMVKDVGVDGKGITLDMIGVVATDGP